jgi:transposase
MIIDNLESKIEAALKENVHFLWLSGKQVPDFRIINDFRGKA